MSCPFVTFLSKLRKQSAESVENIASFDQFKAYLHITRPVETELRDILRKVNQMGGKHLVLLCGSAGDGKSHLLSYLSNLDGEKLLEGYRIYNDATESSAPMLTSIDTLAEELSAFNDEHYLEADEAKMILAINLGTLNNFIESDQGKAFSKLKEYVESSQIISARESQRNIQVSDVFHHVSFSDYQIFSLKEEGIGSDDLEELFSKVFSQCEDNPFYQVYRENSSCTICQKCPVRHNYEFLSSPKYQKAVIRRIVETIVKDKMVVSTRDILNLMYDIVVHPEFSLQTMCKIGTSDVKYLKYYLESTTPMLLNEFQDISPLINAIRSHDCLKERTEELDQDVARFYTLENIETAFENAANGLPYAALQDLTKINVLGAIKPDLKKLVYRFVVRAKGMKGELPESDSQKNFNAFLRYLFYQNSGRDGKFTSPVYDMAKKAVMNWDGQFDSGYICIDDTNDRYWILEKLELGSVVSVKKEPVTEEVFRFPTSIKVSFKKKGSYTGDIRSLDIDYVLFDMILAMEDGYRPTVKDRNHHADFGSFVQRLSELGGKSEQIVLVSKDTNAAQKIRFQANDFDGYEFRVI